MSMRVAGTRSWEKRLESSVGEKSRDVVEVALGDLREEAAQENVELDDSLFVELRNYSMHEWVRDLPDDDLRAVIIGMGRMAIRRRRARVGAGMVREVIFRLCQDPFSDCRDAAKKILTIKGASDFDLSLLADTEKERGA